VRVRLFHTLPSEGRTSSEVYAHELGQALRALPEAAADITDFPALAGAGSAGHGPISGPVRRYADRYLHYQWQARRRSADVNHIVDHGYGHLAFSLDPRRTVVTFHDALLLKLAARELPVSSLPRLTIAGQRLSLRAIRRCAQVITGSDSARRDFLRFVPYDPARVTTIYYGVADLFSSGRADRSGDRLGEVGERAPRLLHVGHCGFNKNIEGILQALPGISRAVGRPALFVKVGGPFSARQIALIRKLGLDAQIQHLGHVPRAQLPGLYADADVLLMPSLHEGFGLPVLEAMACGTPVVASRAGGLPEVAGDAALLVEVQDPAGLVDATVRVLTDATLRADLQRRGVERARLFTWRETALRTWRVYERVYLENA
jgi:glycosyltransferase involved in cell wall biosynthesis